MLPAVSLLRFGPVVARALFFAMRVHQHQVRRYTGEPYIVHLLAVARLVRQVTDDPELIAAALLHDVLEDTPTTREELAQLFGARVARIVWELTSVSRPEDGNRRHRKARDQAHTANASPEAKTIKLADIIDNLKTIVTDDPKFARVYLEEKRLLLQVLTDGHVQLLARAQAAIQLGLYQLSTQAL